MFTGFLCGMFLFSCGGPVSPEGYLAYVNDPANGLIKIKSFEQFAVSAQYRSADYLLSQRLQREALAPAAIDQYRTTLDDSRTFRLQLTSTAEGQDVLAYGMASQEDLEIRRAFLSFRLAPNCHLVCEGDTLACQLAHFEPTYGLSPHATILLSFPGDDCAGDQQLIIDDLSYGTGRLKFLFSAEELSDQPELAL